MPLPAKFRDPVTRAAVCELIHTADLFMESTNESVLAMCVLVHKRIAELVYGNAILATKAVSDEELEDMIEAWTLAHEQTVAEDLAELPVQ